MLRPLTVEDAQVMSVVLADLSLYEFTGGEPPSVADLERRYAVQTRGHSADGTEDWINLVVVLKSLEQAVGFVQATVARSDGRAEIAWVIGRPWQGHGYATEAARLLVEHLAARGVECVVAHIHPEHEASQRIARRLGMAPTDLIVDGETKWIGHLA